MAVTYDFQTPGVSTSAADTQEDIRNIAEMSWVWHVNASPHTLTNKPTGLIEAFYYNTVDFTSSIPSYGYQNYYSLKAYDGTNLGNVNFGDLWVHYDGAVLSNTIGARGEEFISMGVYAGYSCEDSASWIINADVGNSGSSGYDPILAFKNQTTERARIYTDTSDSHKLKFDVGGSDQMVIDSSGKVGIGTSSPSARFEVADSATSGTILRISNNNDFLSANDFVGKLEFYSEEDSSPANTVRAYVGAKSYDAFNRVNLVFATGDYSSSATERMVIDPYGNVGIGTSSPAYELDVRGNATSDHGQISLGNSDASKFLMSISGHSADNPAIFWENSQDLRFATASNPSGSSFTERMRIDSSGNVGIGTSSPGAKLHATGDIVAQNATNPTVSANDNGTLGASDKSVYIRYDTTNDVGVVGSFHNGTGAKNLVLNQLGGNVGIGTSSPSHKLDVVGDIQIDTGNLVIGTSGKGIDFSATSDVAGATSELLDDYEEGTFTPSYVSSNGNLNPASSPGTGEYTVARDGSYTKIGNCVFFRLRMSTDTINLSGATGTVRISGLPFTANNDATYIHYPASILTQNWGANPPQSCQVIPGTSLIYLYRDKSSTGNLTGNTISDLSTGSNNNDVTITGHYYI